MKELRALGSEPEFIRLDLGSLASVREAAEGWISKNNPLDILINNAGLAGHRGQTKDGFELTFGVNHLGPYLFTRLLIPHLKPNARIINLGSKAHYRAKGFDWPALERSTATLTGLREYERSKLANHLFTRALIRRLPSEKAWVYTVHPGVVASDIWRRVPQPFRWLMMRNMITNEEGAEGPLLLTTANAENGAYYSRTKPKDPNPVSLDETLQDELWSRSARWTGVPNELYSD